MISSQHKEFCWCDLDFEVLAAVETGFLLRPFSQLPDQNLTLSINSEVKAADNLYRDERDAL